MLQSLREQPNRFCAQANVGVEDEYRTTSNAFGDSAVDSRGVSVVDTTDHTAVIPGFQNSGRVIGGSVINDDNISNDAVKSRWEAVQDRPHNVDAVEGYDHNCDCLIHRFHCTPGPRV